MVLFSPDNRIHRQSLDEQGRDGQPGQGTSFRAASSARFEAGFLSSLGGLHIGAFGRASSVPGCSGALAALQSRRTCTRTLVCGLNSPRVCVPLASPEVPNNHCQNVAVSVRSWILFVTFATNVSVFMLSCRVCLTTLKLCSQHSVVGIIVSVFIISIHNKGWLSRPTRLKNLGG